MEMEKAEFLKVLTALHDSSKGGSIADLNPSSNGNFECATLTSYKDLIRDFREEADRNTKNSLKDLESRLIGHYSGIIEHLECELSRALSLREGADLLWSQEQAKRDRSQVFILHSIEEKCRDAYNVSQSEYESRINDCIRNYDRLLEDAEISLARQKQKHDSRWDSMLRAVERWKKDQQRDLDAKYTKIQKETEKAYNVKFEALQKELNKVSLEKFSLTSNQSNGKISGLSPGQIQILKYQFDLLKIDSDEQNKILFDILGNIYSVTAHIDLLSDRIKALTDTPDSNTAASTSRTSNDIQSSRDDGSIFTEFNSIACDAKRSLEQLRVELDAESLTFEESFKRYLDAELAGLQ
jgi:hypothetical protein